MAQTAIEWLIEMQTSQKGMLFGSDIEKAKEMEKQQIIEAYGEGKTNGMDISHPLSLTKEISAEQYYKETFNKQDE